MTPTVDQLLRVALFVIVTGAWMVGFWAYTGWLKKARDAGYRYWPINPLIQLRFLASREFVVFLASGAVTAVAIATGFFLFSRH
jgi:hypothetical protein